MIIIILDFIDNHWQEFVEHCKYHGIDDAEEVEREIERLKGE